MTLQPGDAAPAFEALDQHGNAIRLADLRGQRVALYFYPKDDTPGCTAQACSLRDNEAQLKAAGVTVLGVSTDDVASHQRFAQKYELPFSLLADPDRKLVEAYDVWQEKKNYGKTYWGTVRTTFLIDAEGKIERIIRRPDTKEHAAQLLK
ncbi:thioredoxin-dependent thiol peroxidase [Hymenobacter busanensis]|uniref:thioredoxin-dependent peroxiredoxin n=1 Tax=Hymenobacter busanensis TaxID=2607656 RepID=A0A7L5A2X7_9BACT|nr:thioredoxin-dependent thiol peroxidase [Hymenobacter busanensis]KAA9327734.1 thioredoxin-dependent thiol peroxidase [Hymenobacter busanensis]QHJ09563.1 thioredoxin-dependent thiol peroxidase [Hymenobacter busanensis]